MNDKDGVIVSIFLVVVSLFIFVGPIIFISVSESKKVCETKNIIKRGVVIDTYEKVWKDIFFTGYVGSTRKAIIEFDNKIRKEIDSDNLVKGDIYEEKRIERNCE